MSTALIFSIRMKIITSKTLLGSLTLASALFVIPMLTQAADASININHDGKVTLPQVEVTSVVGNVVNAVVRIRNATTSVAITTTASTSIDTKTTFHGTLSDIKVGDRLNISGLFTGIGTSLNITAQKIRNLTSFISFRVKSGTIKSINTANNSFVLKMVNGKLMTVNYNASTTINIGNLGNGSSTLAGALALNSKVEVRGLVSTDGSVLNASKIIVKKPEKVNKGKKFD